MLTAADIKKGKLRYVRNCFPHHGEHGSPLFIRAGFEQSWAS
jgi:hypothetical protein